MRLVPKSCHVHQSHFMFEHVLFDLDKCFVSSLDSFPNVGNRPFLSEMEKDWSSMIPKKTMHFYKNRRESRLVILLDYSCISLQLCADIIWRTLLCSVLFPMHFFLRDIQRLMKCIATFFCDNGAIVLLFSVSVIS